MAKGLLLAAVNFANVPGDDFNKWQDEEHVPERLNAPGFINGKRWLAVNDPKISVNTYDLESLDALKSAAYLGFSGQNSSERSKRVIGQCTRMLRVTAEQILPGDALQPENTGALLFNVLNVAPENEDDLFSWFTQEHIPALGKVPGALCARFFRANDQSSTHKFVAMYHLTGPEIPDSEAWKTAASTPWSAKTFQYFRDRIRLVCAPYKK